MLLIKGLQRRRHRGPLVNFDELNVWDVVGCSHPKVESASAVLAS